MENIAINVKELTKVYRIYSKPADRLKESLNLLNKKFHRDFYALKNVSFQVKRGETVGIIGKNGSGKSTLLKIITGVLTQTSGDIEVNGRISALLELGTGFNPEYTGIENIYLSGTMIGYTKEQIDAKLGSILEFADIGDFVGQQVKTYSSGMFARLAFSVMINFEPDILIVDEALSVGDIFFQQKCNIYMKEKMKGVTKLLVTHDMNAIANFADRAIVLSNGKKIFEGDPLTAIEFYTKSMHNEVFSGEQEVVTTDLAELRDDNVNWIPIEEEKLGGALEIKILSYNFKIDGQYSKNYIKKGSTLEMEMLIFGSRNANELIFGYTVNDKYGNHIFGENTKSSKLEKISIEKNKRYKIVLSIVWPEIQENDYFITLGIGEGTHEMQHVIQCWAHNVIQIQNISLESMHGIFNNKIKNLQVVEC